MKKKKLLYFVEAFGGGIFTYLCNLSNQLCDDFDIYIAYGIREQTPKNFEKYFDKRVHLIRINNYQREISFSKDLAAFKLTLSELIIFRAFCLKLLATSNPCVFSNFS